MNEEEYKLLCEACDNVLLAPDSTVESGAIPWLHVVREHPVFLDNYLDIIESAKGAKVIGRRWLRFLRSRAWWFRQLGRALCSDGQLWFGPKELPRQIDVLFVSHLINASHAGQEDDFYFGELPNELAKQGQSVVVTLINYSCEPAAYLACKWKGSRVQRVVLSVSLRIFDEVLLRMRLKKESLRLRGIAKNEAPGLAQRVLARAAEEALSGSSQTTLRMATQIGALVAKLQPKVIVVTHEGHAWERVAFATARSVHPNVRCIGYQHAAVFRLQHAIRRNLEREYNPDNILTAGIVSKAQLERAPGLIGIPISVLGSNRNYKRGKTSHRMHADREVHSDSRACLVLPEGITSECHLLFEFSLLCALANPEIQFIWRLHPIVSFESLTAQNRKLRNLPGNILVSQSTLEEDITRSCWALYRGTTAIVQAVTAGICPIYLMLPGELTIDPLYEVEGWRAKVATILDLENLINNTGRYDDAEFKTQLIESEMWMAKKYCEDFFMPFNVNTLL